jgi:hypothetical protein
MMSTAGIHDNSSMLGNTIIITDASISMQPAGMKITEPLPTLHQKHHQYTVGYKLHARGCSCSCCCWRCEHSLTNSTRRGAAAIKSCNCCGTCCSFCTSQALLLLALLHHPTKRTTAQR